MSGETNRPHFHGARIKRGDDNWLLFYGAWSTSIAPNQRWESNSTLVTNYPSEQEIRSGFAVAVRTHDEEHAQLLFQEQLVEQLVRELKNPPPPPPIEEEKEEGDLTRAIRELNILDDE